MSVSHDDVRRIAGLARLGIPEDRLDAVAAELRGILEHVDVLASVTTSVEPSASAAMPLAPDEPPSVPLTLPRESFAPLMRDGFFLVPRLPTHDDSASSP